MARESGTDEGTARQEVGILSLGLCNRDVMFIAGISVIHLSMASLQKCLPLTQVFMDFPGAVS